MIDWPRTELEFKKNRDNLKVRDRIYVICSICKESRIVVYRMYKRITNDGKQAYKCSTCTRKINGQKLAKLGHRPDSKSISRNSKRLWEDQEYRTKTTKSIREAMSDINLRSEISRRNKRNSMILWSSPEYRGRQKQGYQSTQARTISELRKAFRSPELRKKLSDNTRRLWLDQEYRDKIVKSSVESYRKKPSHHCSSIQKLLYSLLDDLGVKYFREYDNQPADKECCIGPYTCDCVIPRKGRSSLIIECNGDWIHSQAHCVLRDRQKATYITKYFADSYELRYIWEHEFKCRNKVIENIKYWLGISNLELTEFDFDDVSVRVCDDTNKYKLLLSKYHYLVNAGRGGIVYGAYLGDLLIATCVFSPIIRQNIKIRNYKQNAVRELSRLCINPKYQKRNFASWFVTRCVKLLPKQYKAIIAYSDTTFNHFGTVYKACNFLLDKKVPPDFWYVDCDGWVMHKKTLYNHAKKHCMTEKEFASRFNYRKVYGEKKLRFLMERTKLNRPNKSAKVAIPDGVQSSGI